MHVLQSVFIDMAKIRITSIADTLANLIIGTPLLKMDKYNVDPTNECNLTRQFNS